MRARGCCRALSQGSQQRDTAQSSQLCREHPKHPCAHGVANPQPPNPFVDNKDLTENVRNAKPSLILPKEPVLIEMGKQKT